VTTAELDAAIEGVFERHGAVSLFRGVPGPIPYPNVTCISVNEAVVHGIPGPQALREGDIVSIDTGCKLDGWCADAAVTHPVGQVDAVKRKLLEVTRGALELALRLIPEKKKWSEVALEMARLVRGAGFSVVEEFVGHGIGRNLHEDPKVPNYASPETRATDFDLRPGLVIAVEPMVNVGVQEVEVLDDLWTQVTADGLPSAHFEHTLAITKDGPFLLTGPPLPGES
jgi:methionyl aminopeptidase